MMLFIGFIIIILISILNGKAGVSFGLFMITVIGAIIAFDCVMKPLQEDNPKALDVYRGKTELQITYKGNEPIDTIVVFKKEQGEN